MKPYKRNEDITKIIAALEKVRENLIEYKKKHNSVLVVWKDGKIQFIKP